MMPHEIHRGGPGLRELGGGRWFGKGYCGICGEPATEDDNCPVVPRAVRYWSPDDGWKVGVLCVYCADAVRNRGPQPGDYAYGGPGGDSRREAIDVVADILGDDLDGMVAEVEDLQVMGY